MNAISPFFLRRKLSRVKGVASVWAASCPLQGISFYKRKRRAQSLLFYKKRGTIVVWNVRLMKFYKN